MKIKITRAKLPSCTPGTMTVDGEFFGYSLELSWKDNQNSVSCIPPGSYPIGITYSPRFGRKMILVRDVPNRGGIRIHGANRASQLRGCIAVSWKRPTPETLQEDLSRALQVLVETALGRGESVTLEIV